MAPLTQLVIDPLRHPNPAVRAAGFNLDDPYLEHVWAGVIGPTATLLLRRLPGLWHAATPASIDAAGFSASLGLHPGADGSNSHLWRAFSRLARFDLATPIEAGRVGVFDQVGPVPERLLARLPRSVAQVHERMLGDHLAPFGQANAADSTNRTAHVGARLDRLQRMPRPDSAAGVVL